MVKKTRQNVFETNSSSTHSITISNEGPLINDGSIEPDEDGIVWLYGGQFGWGYDVFTDNRTKANYCATWIATYGCYGYYDDDDDKFERLEEAIRLVVENCTMVKLDINPEDNSSYIDHQSSDELPDNLCSTSDYINFIFNPNSVLIIDNDNH